VDRSQSSTDVLVIGAGFAGLYILHTLRKMGMNAVGVEAAPDVGGTWYWNRYPGARCDVESLVYCYSFSPELVREWNWSERFAGQPEILRYLNFVADRFDLRSDIRFSTRLTGAHYDEQARLWRATLDDGTGIDARFCVMATGCLSEGRTPPFPGLDRFKGDQFHTGSWPHEPPDFVGKRVGVIGTDSSGVQIIPLLAEQAAQTVVFQRTPAFTIPARNGPLGGTFVKHFRANHARYVADMRASRIFGSGDLDQPDEERVPRANSAMDLDVEEREKVYEGWWSRGGAYYAIAFPDQILNPESNEHAANYVRRKIGEIVADPTRAASLTPRGFPIGSKRICLGTDYYETYNRDNVSLVDLLDDPIEEIVETGIRTRRGVQRLDAIVFATGFDAMTGALDRIDIHGRGGRPLTAAWATGPDAYLGLAVAGFPNLFLITGPGSPSVISNVVLSIEQHVEWISDCLSFLQRTGRTSIEATEEAQHDWVAHVSEVAHSTLFPVANSWYVGANVPGKPRTFMVYVGGIANYRKVCDAVAADGYRGFTLI